MTDTGVIAAAGAICSASLRGRTERGGPVAPRTWCRQPHLVAQSTGLVDIRDGRRHARGQRSAQESRRAEPWTGSSKRQVEASNNALLMSAGLRWMENDRS